jgi:four helix bundle protein
MKMKSDNIIQIKSYAFAVKVVNVYRQLIDSKKEYVLTKQMLRSGTAIGAMVEEAIGAQTDKDFLHKLTIAYKEARETKYWIRLLRDTHFLNDTRADELLLDVEELLRLIGSIQKTMKTKIDPNSQLPFRNS